MSGRTVTITTLAAAAATVIAALATNGSAAIDALAAFPKVLVAFSRGLPAGYWSTFVAGLIACLIWLHARRRLVVKGGGRDGRDFRADNLALVTSITCTLAQTIAAGRTDAYDLLMAGMLGLMAGLLAPFAMRGIAALICNARNDDATPEA
jgi:hypothetical protein